MNWQEWLNHSTQGDSARTIATKINRSHTTVSRWMRDGVPAEAPVEIARAYRADVLAGLVASGWLKRCKLGSVISLREIPTHVLVAEIRRRERW